MDGTHDRDSDLGEDSPMSHNDDELSDNEHDLEGGDSSDEGVGVGPHAGPLGPLAGHGPVPPHGLDLSEHPDVLEKLKMQVRDMKDREDFENSLKSPLHSHLSSLASLSHAPLLSSPSHPPFQMPLGFPFSHPAASFMPPPTSGVASTPVGGASTTGAPNGGGPQGGSASSSSSEGSASSQQTWSFEEQFKQVRQLYEINDDPKRKEFLDDLFTFMQKRGTPINRLPIMAKSVLDLFELYNLVIARGGLVDVINKKLWQEIIKGLHLPSSITSAAFTLRTQYMKYLYPYECDKKNLSSPAELQAAIDGNRREGRRSSYGQYENQMGGQMSLPAVQRSPVPAAMREHLSQQMSPLSLVTGHHPQHPMAPRGMQMPPNMPSLPGLVPNEIEQRMMEYMKLFQPKEIRRPGSQSPPDPLTHRDAAMNVLEMSRLAWWNVYGNNTSPPASINNTSPPGAPEPQKFPFFREALNLSDLPAHHAGVSIKRELQERDPPPPAKRGLVERTHDAANNDEHEERDVKTTPRPQAPVNMNTMGTHFKIASRGDARTGDQQLVVTMELNGVMYEGVLFANTSNGLRSPQSQRLRPMVS